MTAPQPDLQAALFTLMTLRVPFDYAETLPAFIEQHLAANPQFFANQPVVIDLADATTIRSGAHVTHLAGILRQYKLYPIGVVAGTPEQQALFRGQNIPSLGSTVSNRRALDTSGTKRQGSRTKIVNQPVRAGTQVYAQGGDLVVLSSVSPGAEVIADGHVHIYGTLRGRAVAGAMGDDGARIFCRGLEAELLCIAGNYLSAEHIDPALAKIPVQISLDSGRLIIDKI
jgi:septum site-determining protein MinC